MKPRLSYRDTSAALPFPAADAAGPRSAVRHFFATFTLEKCRRLLREMHLGALSLPGGADDSESIRLFEKIPPLLEAVHLLYLSDEAGSDEKNTSSGVAPASGDFTEKIRALLPVQCILEPGLSLSGPSGLPSDLIVVTDSNVPLSPAECEALLSEAVEDIRFMVFKTTFLCTERDNRGSYFSEIFRKGRLHYRCPRFDLPAPATSICKELLKGFRFRMELARSFLEGARMYRALEAYPMTAFMCHQSAEHALNAALFLTTGITPRSHNLARMIRMTGYLFPSVAGVFENEPDFETLELLEKSYSRARYQAGFRIRQEEADAILSKAGSLLDRTEAATASYLVQKQDGKSALL